MGELYDKSQFGDPMNRKIAFVQYIECVIKGAWKQRRGQPDVQNNWKMYVSGIGKDSELWIVRPDGLRRAWNFRPESVVQIGQTTVRFLQEDVEEELAIDEDEQIGNQPKSKVV